MAFQARPVDSVASASGIGAEASAVLPDWRSPALPFLLALLLPGLTRAGGEEPGAPPYHTQARFNQELERPLFATRKSVPLREFLGRLADERQVAILLDRRIDPGRKIDVDVNASTLAEGVAALVAPADAGVTAVGDTLFVAPPGTTRTLRTRLFLKQQELDEILGSENGRKFHLVRRFPIDWEMLTTPRELLSRIAQRYGLAIENAETVPHDLWAAGTIASANAAEGLLLVLTQFDLEFEWTSPTSVRIQPLTPDPRIRNQHRSRELPPQQALERIRDRFPEIEIERKGTALEVAGLLEEHEEITLLLGNRRAPRRSAPAAAESLENRRFTLRMVRQPFAGLLQVLNKQGIEVEYDPAALAAADVDLMQKISLELERAKIEELLSAACEEVGLSYRIEGMRILLTPR